MTYAFNNNVTFYFSAFYIYTYINTCILICMRKSNVWMATPNRNLLFGFINAVMCQNRIVIRTDSSLGQNIH